MNDEDDLPVLTQVLRTGNGRVPASGRESLGGEPRDVPLLADALVIGNEPQAAIEPYLATKALADSADVFAPPDAWDDDHEVAHDGADHFRLPHDQDHRASPTAAFIRTVVASEVELTAPVVVSTPAEPAPIDPAVAHRLRDAVVEDLMTRIDTELDARIAHALQVEVETAIAQLQGRLRTHLAEALRDVVARAVDEELTRLAVSPSDRLH